MRFFDWILGVRRRNEILAQIEEQRLEIRRQTERVEQHIAALDGETGWFERVCREYISNKQNEEMKNGTVSNSTSFDNDSK